MSLSTARSGPRRRSAFAGIVAVVVATLAVGAVSAGSTPVHAIERATSASVSSQTSASMSFRGGMTASVSLTRATTQYGVPAARLEPTTPHSAYGAASSMFSPTLDPATTPTVGVVVSSGMCGGLNYSGFCDGHGTLTIAFSQPVTDPILDVSGLGGYYWCEETRPRDDACDPIEDAGLTLATNADGARTAASWISQQLTITTPGVTFSAPSGVNLATTATTLTAADKAPSFVCDELFPTEDETEPYTMVSNAVAGCGSVTLNGTFQSVTFNLGGHILRAPASGGWANGSNGGTEEGLGDLARFSIRLQDDLGDAPASYDGTSAATHMAGPLRLGAGLTADAVDIVNPTSSPNAGTSASLDTDDAIGDGVRAPDAVRGTTYSVTVPLSGTVQPGTVAGWLDLDRNGLFAASERASATFAAGATSVVLSWAVPALGTLGESYLRLRTSFTAAEVSGPRGVARSGEVEDYRVALAPPTPVIEVEKLVNGQDADAAPGVAVASGSTMSFDFQVSNPGNIRLTGVTLSDDVIPGASIVPPPGWSGALNPGQSATFTATYPAPTIGGQLHTNTATVSGTPVTGGPAVSDTDPANATTQREPAIEVVKLVNGEDANTAPGVLVDAGSTMTFEFEVQNTGNVRLTGITLVDDVIPAASLSPPVGWTGALDPGQSATFTATYPAPAGGDELHVNTATVSGTPVTGEPPVTDADPANATTRPLATILIEKLGESTGGAWVPMDGSAFALRADDAGAPGPVLTTPSVTPVLGVVGRFEAVGLAAGTYWIEETQAPDGFALLAQPVRFTVDAAGAVTITDATAPQVTAAGSTISVRDVPAFALPAAGGPGTGGHTVAGILLLLVAAGAALVARRRPNAG